MALPVCATNECDRACLSGFVTEVIESMVAHNPYTLPLAPVYRATENSHPAALGMMTSWCTIDVAGAPSLLAIDVQNGTAYFALDVNEGSSAHESVLRGRIAVVNGTITELELFINRSRGDHGFSFSALELPSNYEVLMNPPANRTKATREELVALSESVFANYSYPLDLSSTCQFTELGWVVVDPGTNGNGSLAPLGCIWLSNHPLDANARTSLVVDEELGFVVTSGIVPGRAFAYSNISAFIPDQLAAAQEAQIVWFDEILAEGTMPLLYALGATGDTLEVLQLYDEQLQALQINVYLSGPNMTSAWLSPPVAS